MAAGPVDGEVSVFYWDAEFARDSNLENVDTDAAQPGIQAQLWFVNKFGVRVALFSADLGDLNEDDAEYRSADLMWRLISPTDNTYLALGAGWQDAEFTDAGTTLTTVETSGIRVSADGRVGFVGVLQAFGRYTMLFELDDFTESGGDLFRDMEGEEFEVGLIYDVAPFVDIRAGFRSVSFDFTREPLVGTPYAAEVTTDGFFVAAGVHF
jgi:hypothetical protein